MQIFQTITYVIILKQLFTDIHQVYDDRRLQPACK